MPTLLILNSKQRYYGETNNFAINFEQKVQVNRFRINKIILPYSWYNLKSQNYTINGVTHLLPAGSYSITSLISTLNASIAPVIASYNTNQNTITFTNAAPFTCVFAAGSGYLGDALQLNGVIAPATSITSGVINLNLTSNVYITSQALTTYYQSIYVKRKANLVQTIPVNVNSFGFIVYQNQTETVFNCDSQTFANIDVQVRDDDGNLIDLNGQNIIMELELYSTSDFL